MSFRSISFISETLIFLYFQKSAAKVQRIFGICKFWKKKSPYSTGERGMGLSHKSDKNDWRLFYLLAGDGVDAIFAEDEDLTVM